MLIRGWEKRLWEADADAMAYKDVVKMTCIESKKGEYGGEHGYGSRMKSRCWKCAYKN